MHDLKKITAYTCFISAVTAAVIIAAGCKNKDLQIFNSLEKDRFLVKTEKAGLRNIEDYLILVGSVKAMDEATLYPRISGKLLKNLLTEGTSVKKDQTVALIARDEVGAVYEPAPVPSTLNGIVGRIYQDTGANVTPQTPIALVVNQEQVRVAVDVPERYVSKVFMNQPSRIKVAAFPEKIFSGKVYRISPVIDTRTRNAAIEILVDNAAGLLRSGMFAEVRLIAGSTKAGAVAVPAAAVQRDEKDNAYIFVPSNGIAVRLDIKTGIGNSDYVQVRSGIKPGEDVITFGLYGLKDGSKIKVTE
ncbi:MAG: efflux RND transporter periplasmic adaptor subunit [bacterium]